MTILKQFTQKKQHIPSLKEFLQVTDADQRFLVHFDTMKLENKIIEIKTLLKHNQFDKIVKLGCINENFRKICLHDTFSKSWSSLWSTYGIVISKNPNKALLTQAADNQFDLFLGIYFYHKSLLYSKSINTSIDPHYLSQAMKYGSIHAYQKYHQYLYSMIESNRFTTGATQKFLRTIVANTKKLLPYYTSYAYLMLAEAYLHYGLQIKKEKGLSQQVLQAKQAAIQSCKHAIRLYKENDPVVFNASFGANLTSSNSMKCATPTEMITSIQSLFASEPAYSTEIEQTTYTARQATR